MNNDNIIEDKHKKITNNKGIYFEKKIKNIKKKIKKSEFLKLIISDLRRSYNVNKKTKSNNIKSNLNKNTEVTVKSIKNPTVILLILLTKFSHSISIFRYYFF